MCHIGILADDLTGALDAAAPFASPALPVMVVWGAAEAAGNFAIDSESRQVSPAEAVRRVMASLPRLAGCDIAFKKIDSLMRGNTVPEVIACCAADRFASIVIAPAFPGQGRIMRGGRQHLRDETGAWRPLAADLGASLACAGFTATKLPRGEIPAGRGIFICDSETDADLREVSAARLEEPVLWCGTAGLAHALASPRDDGGGFTTPPPALIVVGSRHPVSLRQVARLRADLSGVTAVDHAEALAAPVAAVGARLAAGADAALVFALPPLSADRAQSAYRAVFARLAELPAPGTLVIVGGDTLFRLCAALGASRLDAVGAWSPGIAVSRFADGAWRGADIVSKSGAMGGAARRARLLGAEGAGPAGRPAPRGGAGAGAGPPPRPPAAAPPPHDLLTRFLRN